MKKLGNQLKLVPSKYESTKLGKRYINITFGKGGDGKQSFQATTSMANTGTKLSYLNGEIPMPDAIKKAVEIIRNKEYLNPFKRLPNAGKFNIVLNSYDELFKDHGIMKRIKPDLQIERYKNKRVNRFIIHQVIRLNKARTSREIFWKIAMTLIKSRAMTLVALIHVKPQGHREMAEGQVLKMLKRYRNLLNLDKKIEIRRFYVPKKDGRMRPIGSPEPEGRMLLHVINGLLMIYFQDRMSPHQHAYIKARGTTSAIRDFITNFKSASNIYEFDLKNFFGSVNLLTLDKGLRKELPQDICSFLLKVNLASVKFEEKKQEEVTAELRNEINKESDRLLALEPKQLITGKGVKNFFSYMKKMTDPRGSSGFPQGLSTSTTLSNLVITETIIKRFGKESVLMYADDGIIISEKAQEPNLDFPEGGIKKEISKSGGVKQDFKGIKPLNFLGLEIDEESIKSKTRSGKEMVFDKDEMLIAYLHRQLEETGELENLEHYGMYRRSNATGGRYLLSKLDGFIQSRLYLGKGNEKIDQSFELTCKKSSMCERLKGRFEMDVFNASTICISKLKDKI